ncbi:MAG: ABC transporter ATP-binding protein [Planctomycetes bacterium]|nr:ABC transporter ATP-binding protein [Planctomycetota bacterium]MBI3833587.1 ABC transporter ATP-binding protein [Planctomycetota bacterium]
MNNPLLRAKGIHKSYGTGAAEVKVLRGVALEAAAGEFLAVTGPSGCGKSTLLHILGALDLPDQGELEFRGEPVSSANRTWQASYRNLQVGFVFQFYHLLPELSVLENVLIPRMVLHSYWGWRRNARQCRDEAVKLLERMGLQHRLRHRPRELSGGEQQRTAIARALINKPDLLLADEPTGNLDEVTGGTVLGLLGELNRAGQTIIMVTHDAKVAALAHRRVHLSEGVVREKGNPVAERDAARPLMTEVRS